MNGWLNGVQAIGKMLGVLLPLCCRNTEAAIAEADMAEADMAEADIAEADIAEADIAEAAMAAADIAESPRSFFIM